MPLKGKSFSIDTGKFDILLHKLKESKKHVDVLLDKKMNRAVDLVWGVAHARRPMITKQNAKLGRVAKFGRGTKSQHMLYTRVSNPNASAGVPVDTGALQISIQKEVRHYAENWVGKIWTNSPYAEYMEFGTSHIDPRPFMRPAINRTKDALKKIFGATE